MNWTRRASLVSLMLLCAIGSAFARHRHPAGPSAAGDFAYYLLSLSWSPAFCLSSPGAAEWSLAAARMCRGCARYTFASPGIWLRAPVPPMPCAARAGRR
jgi:ribonuclease I